MQNKLTLAVTGHRDIIVTKKLKQEVNAFFEKLLLEYKGDEIILLSPLADGADRLVAKLFLEKQLNYPKLKLYVPMPFSKQRYLEDFDKNSQKEFLELLKSSDKTFSISTQDREENYEKLGYYIADSSNILLALWDKTFNGKSGGTGDVVAYAQSQNYQVKIFFSHRYTTTNSQLIKNI